MSLLPSAKGELFRYSDYAAAYVAFEYDLSLDDKGQNSVVDGKTAATTSTSTMTNVNASSTSTSNPTKKKKQAIVALGGLTDGLFPVPYLPHLAELLHRSNAEKSSESSPSWSLITPLLSSSHRGWGTSSLDRDTDELLELSKHLRTQRGIEGIVLLGHSTGCQDAVRYTEKERKLQQHRLEEDDESKEGDAENRRAQLLGVVLQAPVSDRECFFLNPDTAQLAQERLEKAQEAVQKEKQEPEKTVIDFMSEWDGAPLSAGRWLSLAARGGDDDLFSSDFSDEELQAKLWALGGERAVPVLIISSLREQYLPASYDTAAHGRRLANAINLRQPPRSLAAEQAEAIALDGDHALRGAEAEAARVIFGFVSEKCRMD